MELKWKCIDQYRLPNWSLSIIQRYFSQRGSPPPGAIDNYYAAARILRESGAQDGERLVHIFHRVVQYHALAVYEWCVVAPRSRVGHECLQKVRGPLSVVQPLRDAHASSGMSAASTSLYNVGCSS